MPKGITDQDKELVKQLVIRGEVALIEHGMNKTERREFLNRKEVIADRTRLTRLWEDRKAIQERAAFFSQLDINKMVNPAVSVLARALRGEVPDPQHPGQMTETPTSQQVQAAIEILNRCDVGGKRPEDWSDMQQIADIAQEELTFDTGTEGDSVDKITSRERLRTVMDKMVYVLGKAMLNEGTQGITAKKTRTRIITQGKVGRGGNVGGTGLAPREADTGRSE